MSSALRGQRMTDLILLWIGLLLPASAWAIQMTARYALQPWLCLHGAHIASDLVAAASVLLALTGGGVAWSMRSRLPATSVAASGEQICSRARFMASLGIWLSALFILVIVTQWIPERLLSACPD